MPPSLLWSYGFEILTTTEEIGNPNTGLGHCRDFPQFWQKPQHFWKTATLRNPPHMSCSKPRFTEQTRVTDQKAEKRSYFGRYDTRVPQEQQNEAGKKVRPVAIENIRSLLAKFALRPF